MRQIYNKAFANHLQKKKLCLEKGCFPNKWKKANVVPLHKKMTRIY